MNNRNARREEEAEEISEAIITEKFPKLMSSTNSEVQEAQRTPKKKPKTNKKNQTT